MTTIHVTPFRVLEGEFDLAGWRITGRGHGMVDGRNRHMIIAEKIIDGEAKIVAVYHDEKRNRFCALELKS